jgi:zinc protease
VRYHPSSAEELAQIRALTRDDLAAYYQKNWGASDTEIAVVGDFDAAEIKELLTKKLGDWKPANRYQRIVKKYIENVPAALESVKTPDKPMAFVGAAHAIPVRDDDPEWPAARIINFVLGGSSRSRLFERLRQKEGFSYNTFSLMSAHSLDRVGSLIAGAICAKENADKAMTALMEELEKLRKDGVNDAELSEAKKGFILGWDTQLANDEFVASLLATTAHYGRTLDYYKKLNDRVVALTPAEVNATVKKLLEPSRLIRVRAGDL